MEFDWKYVYFAPLNLISSNLTSSHSFTALDNWKFLAKGNFKANETTEDEQEEEEGEEKRREEKKNENMETVRLKTTFREFKVLLVDRGHPNVFSFKSLRNTISFTISFTGTVWAPLISNVQFSQHLELVPETGKRRRKLLLLLSTSQRRRLASFRVVLFAYDCFV